MLSCNAGTVLVSGASTGIGEALVRRLDTLGYRVFASVRKQADADRLRGSCGPGMTPVLMDITKSETVQSAVSSVADMLRGEGLDGLVNNAGAIYGGPIEFQSLSTIRRQLEVNFVGHIAVTQACLPLLRRDRGRIINVGSGHRFAPAPFVAAYCASKSALCTYSDSLRMELIPWRIAVIMVEVGATRTPMWDKSLPRSERAFLELSAEDRGLYEQAFYRTGEFFEKLRKQSNTPERVAGIIVKALSAKHPKRMYLVGRDTRLAHLCDALLPRAVYHASLAWLSGMR